MSEILKMFELAQQDGVPQVQIGSRRIKPAFTRRGLPVLSQRSSFDRSSDSLTISAAPFLMYASCSSTGGKLVMRFDYNDT